MLLSDSARVNSPNFLAFSSRFGEELVWYSLSDAALFRSHSCVTVQFLCDISPATSSFSTCFSDLPAKELTLKSERLMA